MPQNIDSFYAQIEEAANLAPVMPANELVSLTRKAILRLDYKDVSIRGSRVSRALQVIKAELGKRGHQIGPAAIYG
ncbi:MAG: hypothetical protein BGO03_11790 [Mesorhizobium sp. 61-13]|nr:hypothetical protein [Mesorhizobium sp.]OJU52334.1 MAG: hypothetical protein BGO03_11790 [Mesorhizobium sp. 61-13]